MTSQEVSQARMVYCALLSCMKASLKFVLLDFHLYTCSHIYELIMNRNEVK
jgi:flagellar biosynthesis protein FlhB